MQVREFLRELERDSCLQWSDLQVTETHSKGFKHKADLLTHEAKKEPQVRIPLSMAWLGQRMSLQLHFSSFPKWALHPRLA